MPAPVPVDIASAERRLAEIAAAAQQKLHDVGYADAVLSPYQVERTLAYGGWRGIVRFSVGGWSCGVRLMQLMGWNDNGAHAVETVVRKIVDNIEWRAAQTKAANSPAT